MAQFSPRHLKLLLSALLGFLLTINGPAFATHGPMAEQSLANWQQQASKRPELGVRGPDALISQAPSPLLQTGIRHYQAGQYTDAITSWNQALQITPDPLTQALLLSNLSLAHQHLSQWTEATNTIAQSLALLQSPSDTPIYTETLAKALNTQGRLHWATGDIATALSTWSEATAAYRQTNNTRGILLSLINQAKALQTLGQHVQSKEILQREIVPLLQDSTLAPAVQATGLWQLGNAQRQFGNLPQAKENLQASLDIIEAQRLGAMASPVRLDLANTDLALGNKQQAIGKTKGAQKLRESALAIYQELATSADAATQLQANFNRLSLLIDMEQWGEANELWPAVWPTLEGLSASRTNIYAQLNFANSLMQLLAEKKNREQSTDHASATQRFPLIRGTNGGVFEHSRNGGILHSKAPSIGGFREPSTTLATLRSLTRQSDQGASEEQYESVDQDTFGKSLGRVDYSPAGTLEEAPKPPILGALNRVPVSVKTTDYSPAGTLEEAPKPPRLGALNGVSVGVNGSNGTTQTIALGQFPSSNAIGPIIDHALQQSQAIADPIAESYSIGERGRLYELEQDYPKAQAWTEKALRLTEAMAYADGRYRWEWQQGRLFNKQNQREAAIQSYRNAVSTIQEIRRNLLFIDTEVQFSFRDNVEPVYREMVELLLSEDAANLDNATLDLTVQQLDRLQLSELENFLRCDLTATTNITEFEVADNTAVLHPIILENRLGLISQIQGEKMFTFSDIDQNEMTAFVEQLREDLNQPDRTPEVRQAAKRLHKLLMEPIEAELKRQNIETLVFVLDGPLRNIPMAVLFDGQQYLVEKYAIAVAPELDLFKPEKLSDNLRVFTGGVGTPQEIEGRSFAPIVKLNDELDVISDLFGPQPPMVNQAFSGMTLQEQLSSGRFSGIHIKTHGVFSSDPQETFIVGHQELIRGSELGDLIQLGSSQAATPIELLVLSACDTATGDSRAVLGLAGIAVRAGARSTVSTLWEAEDVPNTELMISFYKELKKPNITRAQALRNAQLALIATGETRPHIWGTYVLVGNWL
ncbi:CHAT domain-containing protein [Leptothoe kymatousa]|uniref:CHAT domain-containing protein n=1 Tax=Leptothoe kymatousa TAU-MAC 1615 TaxID=2364775 RepID=A0ABS5Y2K6_9CYAN|nr:CHAT domain-containing protein [Leptothoe kymatousa]MBT9312045.1 CHAT domain-containing protein [Leptothoe kymatousa TAU-MAC 1615]